MESHYNLSDSNFEQQIRTCQLDPLLFTHEAHLRLAWILITQYGITYAEKNIQNQLLKYVQSLGAKDKYNVTLTIAATKAVYHFMLKSNYDNFKDFIVEFPRLKTDFRSLMSCHYGFDVYNNDKAKMEYMEPDLVPFD